MAEPGNLLGRYRIERLLGRGATGSVYLAFDPALQHTVAIKVLPREIDSPPVRERFFRQEARLTASLNHSNIVATYDVGIFGGQPYVVMEYVPGETLAGVIRRQAPVSISEKLRWMEELCAGIG